MGTWFITSAIGIKIGTTIAQAVSSDIQYDELKGFDIQMTISNFHKYQELFGYVSLVAIVFAIIAFVIGKKLNKMIQE